MIRWIAKTLLATILLVGLATEDQARGQGNEGPGVLPPPSATPAILDVILPLAAPQVPVELPNGAALPDPQANHPQANLPGVPAAESNAAVTPTPATPGEDLSQIFEANPVVVAPLPQWYHLAYWFGPTPWDLGFELGINGTEGFNNVFSFRTGGHLKRETEFWKFDTTLAYNKNTANEIETQNNALLDVRVDRKIGDSPWSLYFLNQELYDEFQAFDLRVSANVGLGYQWIDTKHLDLVGRFGAGASREYGGPDESTAYEALFGMEYDHELSKTQRLSAKFDYFPEWEDFDEYRVVMDIGWEIDLDRPGNMSLKFSIVDRYDSTPNGVNPNELNYSVLLIWGI